MSVFKFKHFQIQQSNAALKVGTDSMLLGALCYWQNPVRLLDIGTGTGVLSLMCAQRFSFREIIGIEISDEALIDAQFNAGNSPFKSPISVIHQAIQEYLPEQPVDAIISNPPFFENSLKNADRQKSLARHTETLSFDELLQSIARLLSSEGKAWIIIPYDARETIKQLADKHQLFPADEIILFGKPHKPVRSILSFVKTELPCTTSSLIIRNEKGLYTQEYKDLTKDFHDRFLQ